MCITIDDDDDEIELVRLENDKGTRGCGGCVGCQNKDEMKQKMNDWKTRIYGSVRGVLFNIFMVVVQPLFISNIIYFYWHEKLIICSRRIGRLLINYL